MLVVMQFGGGPVDRRDTEERLAGYFFLKLCAVDFFIK